MLTKSGPSVPDYARPSALRDAVRPLAGGSGGFWPAEPTCTPARGDGLPELSGIAQDRGLRIGAATTWAAIAEADLPVACRALRQVARQVGGRQVQNAGTIGGNLCNAAPATDGVPPLLALGAEVVPHRLLKALQANPGFHTGANIPGVRGLAPGPTAAEGRNR